MSFAEPVESAPIVIITAEGLATAALSCYGSSWNPTPEFDEIASRGCVWDRLIAASTDPLDVLGVWMDASGGSWRSPNHSRGTIELFTDDARVAQHPSAVRMDYVDLIGERAFRTRTRPYERVEQTRMGRLFASAMDRMTQPNPPGVLWIHTSSLVSTWDAPRYLAVVDDEVWEDDAPSEEVELIVHPSDDELAPEKPAAFFDTITPASLQLKVDSHPDLAMSWMRTYGCQVRLLDLLIGVVRDFEPCNHAKLVIAGTSGFALGENGWIGSGAGPIRSSRLRLPLVMSKPRSLRVPHLISSDAVPSLLGRLSGESEPVVSESEWVQAQSELEPRIRIRGDEQTCLLATPGWFLVEEPTSEPQLFLKPDDAADVNNVARLREDIVQQLLHDAAAQE